MDHRIPVEDGSRFLTVLGQMLHRPRSSGMGNYWLTGFAETLHLIAIDNAAEPGMHKLEPQDIVRVALAWVDFEMDTWSGGFVVHLRDGRTMYIESRAGDHDWNEDSCVAVSEVPEGQELPNLPEHHESELYGWVEGRSEFADYLALLKPVH